MENKPELATQSLSVLCKDGNRLSKENGAIFAQAIIKMSLAKNIKLAEGSIDVWEQCAIEDIRAGNYKLEDFIAATKKVIRVPLFNRIDFADIYLEAIEQAKTRRMKEPISIKLNEPRSPMPAEIKGMLESVGTRI